MSEPWTQAEAIALCVKIHPKTAQFGCYVALTGGCLYHDSPRKDLDLVFYRIRQSPTIDKKGLLAALDWCFGIKQIKGFGFCNKAHLDGRGIDLLFPEEDKFHSTEGEGPYIEDDPEPDPQPEDELVKAVLMAQMLAGVDVTEAG